MRVLAHSCASDPGTGLSAFWALFCRFPDQEVRRMAVQWIGSLSDAELLDYLPQLVQVGGLAFPPVLMVPPPGPQDRLYSSGILLGIEYGQSTKPPVPCFPPRP